MSKQLLSRYEAILGESLDIESLQVKKALRVNTLKISSQNLKKRLEERGVTLQEIPFLKDAFWFEAEFSLASTQEYLLGLFYIQEPASQLVAHILFSDSNFNPELLSSVRVIDMAAAPGSKTTHIAQLTNDKASIIALDSNMSRIGALKNNVDRLGITSVLIYKKDARFADDVGMLFDYVLLDAPCSGNFCVEQNFFEKRSVQDIQSRTKTQQELLRSAHTVLKKGGVLVYSTCSLEAEEDEEMINWFINKYPDMKIETIDCEIGDGGITRFEKKEFSKELSKTKRFWPHKTGLQGFYIAKLKKLN